ncbi:YjgN family protein [Sphingomonas sp.]|uniref:YjgN family protein n=1 Tax=Sphingomonas sp. TaxID=28214 RepID=UPI0025DBD843|nr:YjgN family protein [Sphingomonas sp.]MBV9528775.1 DUF898 domain-containing protein [Sphingomonas sp.]
MDAHTGAAAEDGRAIRFTGNWREYLPIAVTNLLLIICTLGIYRFWAAARQRRYLWSRTHVIDDSLEWTGTGKEMFIGFLIVMLVIAPFLLFFQFVFPALIARGMQAEALGVLLLFYAALVYLGGFARFRALRYRLSRSTWHGIRGGSDNPGWAYGREYLGRVFLAAITVWIAWPWLATELWNERWNKMSFGPLEFDARLDAEGLGWPWALIYLVPLGALVLGFLLLGALGLLASGHANAVASIGFGAIAVILFLVAYLAIPLMTLNWYAKYYRKAAAATSLGELSFAFEATTLQWLGLFLGNIGLAIITLGFGMTYWGYRNWSFMVRHLRVYGTIDIGELTQSTTHAPREAEGFADAFDVGAI